MASFITELNLETISKCRKSEIQVLALTNFSGPDEPDMKNIHSFYPGT